MGVPDLKSAAMAAINPKYRLDRSDFVKTSDGTRLYRIVALRSFGNVEKGERGGYVEGEHNLSHEGNCWIAGLGRVMKRARLEKNALVCDFGEATDDFLGTDDILINGHGRAGGRSRMLHESGLGGRGRIDDDVEMSERSRVGGDALVANRVTLAGEVFIHGSCVLGGTQHFGGNIDMDSGTLTDAIAAKRPVDPVFTFSGA